MRLYEVDEELMAVFVLLDEYAAENEGDVTDFPLNEELEALGRKREELLLTMGAIRKGKIATVKGFADEITSLQKKKKVEENQIKSMDGFMSYHLEKGEKLKDSRCTISLRKSSQLILDVPPELLPPEYTRTKIEADKTALKDLIKTNVECNFAHMEEHYNLQVK